MQNAIQSITSIIAILSDKKIVKISGDEKSIEIDILRLGKFLEEKAKEKEKPVSKKREQKLAVQEAWTFDLATEWMEWSVSQVPSFKPSREKYQKAFDDLCRVENMSEGMLRLIFEFVKKDEFWRKNAISPAGFMKISKNNGIRKINNVIASMRADKSFQMQMWREEMRKQGVKSLLEADYE